MGVGARQPADRHCQPQQRPEQNIGEDQIVRRRAGDSAGIDAGRAHERERAGNAIEPRIGARGLDGDTVDIAGDDARPQYFRRRDRQHAGAGADVEHSPRPPPFRQIIERQQASARGAVMAGAEGQRRFDLDAEVVGPHPHTVMRAVHEEAAGAHRLQTAETLRHPIGGRDRLDDERCRRCLAGDQRDLRAQSGFVRGPSEMDRHLPTSAVALESGASGVVFAEDLAEIGGDPARDRLFANEAGNGGGRIHPSCLSCNARVGEAAANGYVGAAHRKDRDDHRIPRHRRHRNA